MTTLDRIGSAFLRRILLRMKQLGINQGELAKRMKVSKPSTPTKPAEGEFDAFLSGLDHAALKRLRKAVDVRLVGK